jgi:hypothetical protein
MDANASTGYARKTLATAPDGRRVLISTVRHALAVESAVYPMDGEGRVGLLHLHKAKHGPSDDLDTKHEALVEGVEAGTLELVEREATNEEAEEAWGDLLLLGKMITNRAMDDGPSRE